jgi:hypothetical protein
VIKRTHVSSIGWKRAVPAALLALTATGFGSVAQDGDTHRLVADRPPRAGQRFGLRSVHDGTSRIVEIGDGSPAIVVDEWQRIIVDGLIEFTHVDPRDQSLGYAIVLRELAVEVAGDRIELSEPGRRLDVELRRHASIEEQMKLTLDGVEVEAELEEMLAPALSIGLEVENDLILGLPTERRVGETWDIDREAFARAGRDKGVVVEPDDIDGRATLTARGRVEDLPCSTVRLDIAIDRMRPQLGALPPGGNLEAAWGRYTLAMALPDDPSLPTLDTEESGEFVIEITMSGEGGEAQRLRFEQESTGTTHFTPMSDSAWTREAERLRDRILRRDMENVLDPDGG